MDRFDADRAWRLVERQVGVGQQPAARPSCGGSRGASARCCRGRASSRFRASPRLRNVVGTIPGGRPAIVIGAHYDTLAEPQGFVGANNGTAVVIEAARALARLPRSAGVREIRFVLFDGEEPAAGLPEESADFYHHGLRGSRAYVATHRHRRRRGGLRPDAQAGIRIPRVTDQQIRAPGAIKVDRHHLLPGDLVFLRDSSGYVHHVGMSLGGDRFIEAPRTGLKVRISSLDNPYYAQQFTGARRFDPAVNHDVVGQVQPGAEGLGAAAAQSPPDRDAARVMPALLPDQINGRP